MFLVHTFISEVDGADCERHKVYDTLRVKITPINFKFESKFKILNPKSLCFIIFGLIYTAWNIYFNIAIYFKYATKTEMSIEPTEKTAMPTITICLNSMHSRGINFSFFSDSKLEYYYSIL